MKRGLRWSEDDDTSSSDDDTKSAKSPSSQSSKLKSNQGTVFLQFELMFDIAALLLCFLELLS